jgi:hypothetical protein
MGIVFFRWLEAVASYRRRPARVKIGLLQGGGGRYGVASAGVAQLVEHKLPKLGVEGSNPFSRSKKPLQIG